ncbi:MAG TPA: glycosyl hydrolase 108 family protein [Acidocella sp.]|nr:glycosyl hydrolase 108 family protein [Acidocella sp.]
MNNFFRALEFTWRPENDGQPYHITPGDPGGATAWAVTQETWNVWAGQIGLSRDLKEATKTQLEDCLLNLFWIPCGAPKLPTGVDLMVFDFCVTSGQGNAVRELQRCVGVADDGDVGPVTLAAAYQYSPMRVCTMLRDATAQFLALADLGEFLNGELRRAQDRYALACQWITQEARCT